MSGEMKKVILTGPTGAIGRALTEEFLARGTEVLLLVNPGSPRNALLPRREGVRIAECALEDLAGLDPESLRCEDGQAAGGAYDAWYHLAWQGTGGAGRNDMDLQNANVKYSLDAVRAAARFGCSRFVGFGSQAEYGRSSEKLTAETPVRPEMGYGYAKLCAGQMTRDLAHSLGLSHIWVRILSIYGPGDTPNSMISSLIAALQKGETPRLTPGEQAWDFLYSGDAAKALCLLGDRGIDGKVYVLGSGQTKSIREYAQIVRDIASPGAEIDFGAVPYGARQIMYLCADITELTQDTGWKPETDFAEGIRRILEARKDR